MSNGVSLSGFCSALYENPRLRIKLMVYALSCLVLPSAILMSVGLSERLVLTGTAVIVLPFQYAIYRLLAISHSHSEEEKRVRAQSRRNVGVGHFDSERTKRLSVKDAGDLVHESGESDHGQTSRKLSVVATSGAAAVMARVREKVQAGGVVIYPAVTTQIQLLSQQRASKRQTPENEIEYATTTADVISALRTGVAVEIQSSANGQSIVVNGVDRNGNSVAVSVYLPEDEAAPLAIKSFDIMSGH